MVNTKLVMELEKLFKQKPFNLENEIFVIKAENGSITVEEYGDLNEEAEEQIAELEREVDEKERTIEDLRELLDENDIEHYHI